MSEDRQSQRYLVLLGQAIREARAQTELDLKQLSDRTGVGPERIAALEAGELDPDFELLLALADGVGVRPSALILRAEALGKDSPAE